MEINEQQQQAIRNRMDYFFPELNEAKAKSGKKKNAMPPMGASPTVMTPPGGGVNPKMDEEGNFKKNEKAKGRGKNASASSMMAAAARTLQGTRSGNVNPKKNEKAKSKKGKNAGRGFFTGGGGPRIGASSDTGAIGMGAKALFGNRKKNIKENIDPMTGLRRLNENHNPGGFETHVICGQCGYDGDFDISIKKTMIKCPRCGYADLTENIVGLGRQI